MPTPSQAGPSTVRAPPPRVQSPPSPAQTPPPGRVFTTLRRASSSSELSYASEHANSPPVSRSPSPTSPTPVDHPSREDDRKDSASVVYDSDSVSGSEYHSLSGSSGNESEDNAELEALRRDLERPSTPPTHTHHSLCLCPDKPDNLTTPRAGPSTSRSAIVSPTRSLRPDPYSSLSPLERTIVLYIQHNSSLRTIDITSIGQAVMISKPLTGPRALRYAPSLTLHA